MTISPNKDTNTHSNSIKKTNKVLQREDWQKTQKQVSKVLDNLCDVGSATASKAVARHLPEGTIRELGEVGTKIAFNSVCKSDFVRNNLTNGAVLAKKGGHKFVPFSDPGIPTKGDHYAPWQ